MAVVGLRGQVERTGHDVPKRMPVAERAIRFGQLKVCLVGEEIEGALEPPHALIETVAQMLDDGVLTYIA